MAVVNAGLDGLQEEYEDEASLSNPDPTFQPPMLPLETHSRRPTAGAGALPGPYSTPLYSGYYSLSGERFWVTDVLPVAAAQQYRPAKAVPPAIQAYDCFHPKNVKTYDISQHCPTLKQSQADRKRAEVYIFLQDFTH